MRNALVAILLLLWMNRPPLWAGEGLFLVASDANPLYSNAANDGLVDRMAQQVFQRLAIPLTIAQLPSARALINANRGWVDGDMLRIAGLESRYPNLIRVEEPWLDMEFLALTRDPAVRINTWRDIRGLDLAMIKGWKVFEDHVQGSRSLLRVNSADHLFNLLDKKRVDAILYDKRQGAYYSALYGMGDLHPAGAVLTVQPVYLYLHKKHAHLVSAIAEQLRQIKAQEPVQTTPPVN